MIAIGIALVIAAIVLMACLLRLRRRSADITPPPTIDEYWAAEEADERARRGMKCDG